MATGTLNKPDSAYDADADEAHDLSHIKASELDGSHEKAPGLDQAWGNMLKDSNLGDTFAGNKKADSADDLKSAEDNAANNDEPDDSGSSGSGRRRFWTRARTRATGAIAGTGILGTLLIGNLSLGPLQIVHLSEVLLHAFSRQQSDTSDSQHKWLRDLNALKNKDWRYSRVGLIGGAMANSLTNELEASGIKFTGSDSLGRPTGVELDQEKLAKSNPEIGDLSSEEFDNWAKENFNIDGDVKDGKFDIGGFKDQDIAKTLKTSRGLAGNSGVISGLKTRSLKKFWGLGSLFHPFSRAWDNRIRAQEAARAKAQEEEKNNAGEEETPPEEEGVGSTDPATQVMEEQENVDIQSTEPKVTEGAESIEKEANDPARKIAGAVSFTGGQALAFGCTAKDGVKAIDTIDRLGTVMPAMFAVIRVMAMAAQIKAGGTDISVAQVGGMVNSFTATAQSDKDTGNKDAGTTIWQGGTLALLAGTIKPNSQGSVPNDLNVKRQRAFNPPHASGLLQLANAMIDIGAPVTHSCGILGTVELGIEGAVENLVLAAINLPDGESGLPATEIGVRVAMSKLISVALKLAESATLGVAEGLVLNQIKDIAVNSQTAKQLAADAFSGAQGGDLLAYGARAGGNLVAAASGGIPDPDSSSTTALGSYGAEEQQSFEQESFYARLFDISDTRSLLGHLSMDITPGFGTNVSPLFNSVLGTYSSIPSSLLSLFTGSSFADTTTGSWTGNYDWGFPQYGVPSNIMNADDPAQNADDLTTYLHNTCPGGAIDGPCGPFTGYAGGYTSRIIACFGNDLTESGELWDISPAIAPDSGDPVDVDPGSQAYQDSDCSNTNNGGVTVCTGDDDTTPSCIWGRIILFVNDTGTLKAMACATENTSCSDIGAPQTTDAPASTSTQTTDSTTQSQSSMAPAASHAASHNKAAQSIAVTATSRGLLDLPSLPTDMKWIRSSTTAVLPRTRVAL